MNTTSIKSYKNTLGIENESLILNNNQEKIIDDKKINDELKENVDYSNVNDNIINDELKKKVDDYKLNVVDNKKINVQNRFKKFLRCKRTDLATKEIYEYLKNLKTVYKRYIAEEKEIKNKSDEGNAILPLNDKGNGRTRLEKLMKKGFVNESKKFKEELQNRNDKEIENNLKDQLGTDIKKRGKKKTC